MSEPKDDKPQDAVLFVDQQTFDGVELFVSQPRWPPPSAWGCSKCHSHGTGTHACPYDVLVARLEEARAACQELAQGNGAVSRLAQVVESVCTALLEVERTR